ncbi:MAG: glycosyltransferase family 2 protein, partial [Acidimicrobiales bacterium]
LREMGHGANMAWRRQVLEEIGGFDEGMGPGTPFRAAEDQDAFWRSLQSGGEGRYVPDSIVVHRHWRNRRQQLRTVYGYGIGSGALAVKRWRVDAGDTTSPAALPVRSLVWDVQRLAARLAAKRMTDHLRGGYEMGAVGELLFLAGLMRGSTGARRVTLSDGRFAHPAWRAASQGVGDGSR